MSGHRAVTVTGPASLRGDLRVPGDKSISHRALIVAALADGTSRLSGLSEGADVAHTARAVEAMGATLEQGRVTGARLRPPHDAVDCGNSGTGMRLLAGVAAALPGTTRLDGDRSLRTRPMDRIAEPLRLMGATVDGVGDRVLPPLVVTGGRLRGIDYTPPVASAQVKSAVLLAGLAAAEGATTVREPVRTRAHTEELLRLAGVDVVDHDGVVSLRPARPTAFVLDIPGDPSQAAFWIVAATICPHSDVTVRNVYLGRARAGFVDVLGRMGADLEVDEQTGSLRARTSALRGTEIAGAEIAGVIDELPVLAVAAACADGATVVRDAGELRVKESDRVARTVALLRALGADADERPDGFVVGGSSAFRGGTVDAGGDHRIAMSAVVAAAAGRGPVVVDGFESVATSYPTFVEHLVELAGADVVGG